MSDTINSLSSTDELAPGDNFPIYDASNGDDRKIALSLLLAYMQSNLSFSEGVGAFSTQYASPSATGFTVAITDGSDNIHLILTPLAGYAAGTITLPAVGNAVDKQLVTVNCTQSVTTLTVDGNGAVAVTGEPASLSANDFFTLKYDSTFQTWYRIA